MGAAPAIRAALLGKLPYRDRVLQTQPASLLAYWLLGEASGTTITDRSGNGRTGTYTGVDLGQAGIGDGGTTPFFDGVNDYGNVQGASLAAAFNGAAGTIAVWVNAQTFWADSVARRIWQLQADASNSVILLKTSTNNLQWFYTAGGTAKSVTLSGAAFLDRFYHFALTWDKAADQMKAYIDGIQTGATQTGLGTWAGTPTLNILGASSTVPAGPWKGKLAHAAVWSVAHTPAEIARLGVR